jgi:hypothetical protein
MEDLMFVTIRKYPVCKDAKEVNRIAQAEVLPVLRAAPGFRSYVFIDSGDHTVTSISVFDSKEAADNASQRVREMVKKSISKLLPKPPDVTMGEVLTDAKK